ncbi:DNA-processing protein DprA [Methylophaga pinxianii]|uniref:DNA-processing protein DprA n=1 Tax=Methylophaga pinxianii TaxID=2881052 RepID=UPI001CF13FD1|nr:DNA-processing protein DprA [Methylophaga pinxianii]MCB2427088.1 DNA-processing protein DprA [Methylophaga pinxianii]UPH46014.1 DNA-processing protein DprA [Methylophaga pinxianii]
MHRFSASQLSLACQLALQRIPGVGPATFSKLVGQVNSPADIFREPRLLKGIDPKIVSLLQTPDWDQVEQDLQWLSADNRHVIDQQHPLYPELLQQISDPPALLFVQGDIHLLSKWQLAVVGSRNPSASGRDTAFDFARYLAQGDIVITSGLATGIDAAAHKGALAGAGKTIAVIGTGLDRVYPAAHRDLAHHIAENGAIVSEFPLGTSPKAENFPRRNRIISGLSLGTLVVEAAVKSGSLITARMAMEQGREVFAIPGSIHNPLSRGCHQLIREGAKLVETANDIIEELGAMAGVVPQSEAQTVFSQTDFNTKELDNDYQQLFEFLGYDPIHIDMLIDKSGLTADAVSSMLLLLELQGQVATLPGGRYVRTGIGPGP